MTLVEMRNDDLKIDSRLIALNMELEHRALIRLIDKYKSRFESLGTLSFENAKSAGRPIRFLWLNETQALFLCTLFKNSEIVLDFKEQMSRDFTAMKKALLEIKIRQQNSEWIERRKSGKIARKDETDIIKNFVKYATQQGSENASRYYGNITRMENKALFIIEHKFKNVRDALDGQQLSVLSTCDQIVAKSLRDGMIEELFYKDIYKKAKKDVLNFVDLVGTSYVPKSDKLLAPK